MLHQDQLPTCQSPTHSIHHSLTEFPSSLAVFLGANQRSRKEQETLDSLTCHQKDKIPTAASTAELLSELGSQTLDNPVTMQSRRWSPRMPSNRELHLLSVAAEQLIQHEQLKKTCCPYYLRVQEDQEFSLTGFHTSSSFKKLQSRCPVEDGVLSECSIEEESPSLWLKQDEFPQVVALRASALWWLVVRSHLQFLLYQRQQGRAGKPAFFLSPPYACLCSISHNIPRIGIPQCLSDLRVCHTLPQLFLKGFVWNGGMPEDGTSLDLQMHFHGVNTPPRLVTGTALRRDAQSSSSQRVLSSGCSQLKIRF